MKKTLLLFLLISILCLTLLAVACGESSEDSSLQEFSGITFESKTVDYDGRSHSLSINGAPDGATVSYDNNAYTMPGTYKITADIQKEGYRSKRLSATLTINMPTAQTIINAKDNAKNDNYDFDLSLSGSVNLFGYNGKASVEYKAKYRSDEADGSYTFSRTAGGTLIGEHTEYIFMQNDTKLLMNTNKNGDVTKVKVVSNEDESISLINLPITSLISSLTANNLKNIKTSDKYQFRTDISIASDNALVNKLLGIVAKQGMNLSFKNVTFTNPVGGLVLYFNLSEKMELSDYEIGIQLTLPVKGINVRFDLKYAQKASETPINVPTVAGLYYGNPVEQQLDVLNDAILAVKSADTYSLNILAENQFDPGWNVTATTDKYSGTVYKNTYKIDDLDFVAFNHSYEYKTHHETDGKETYKFTIGNVENDGATYRISRKNKNTSTLLDNVTADSTFDYLTSGFYFTADEVDCITKKTEGSSTVYTLYLNDIAASNISSKVLSYINSNEEEGVITVDNYFDNDDFNVKECVLTVTLKSGKLVSINAETKIKYNPVDGEYTDDRITLTDSLTLTVNDEADKAKAYTAPNKVETSLKGYGLNNAKYYIN